MVNKDDCVVLVIDDQIEEIKGLLWVLASMPNIIPVTITGENINQDSLEDMIVRIKPDVVLIDQYIGDYILGSEVIEHLEDRTRYFELNGVPVVSISSQNIRQFEYGFAQKRGLGIPYGEETREINKSFKKLIKEMIESIPTTD